MTTFVYVIKRRFIFVKSMVKFYGKIHAKSLSTPGLVFVSWNSLLSVTKINLYLFQDKRSGLLDTAKFKGKVTLTVWARLLEHYENKPIQIYWKFFHQKLKIFR